MENLDEYCENEYKNIWYRSVLDASKELASDTSLEDISADKMKQFEIAAQKAAIKQTTIDAWIKFPNISLATIWKTVYEIHVHHKSGIKDAETIAKVISADQSWKKSSGHAFEEMIKQLGNEALRGSNIEIVLQRDLNTLIKESKLGNKQRDIDWLNNQIENTIFDLYILVNNNNKKYCYGCIQSKTSIRDRVTRDREPSMQAMKQFFWSTIIVLDGDFLKLPKFIGMVNGGTKEFPENGWHGMYVLSQTESNDRIKPTDYSLLSFRDDAIKAAKQWLEDRQWLDSNWPKQPN